MTVRIRARTNLVLRERAVKDVKRALRRRAARLGPVADERLPATSSRLSVKTGRIDPYQRQSREAQASESTGFKDYNENLSE